MHRHRNAKIVATLGPASADRATIQALFEAGADVFRLNFSHGTHEDHKKRVDTIRDIERDAGRPVWRAAGLAGPQTASGNLCQWPRHSEGGRQLPSGSEPGIGR